MNEHLTDPGHSFSSEHIIEQVHHHTEAMPFTEEEIREFHGQDYAAGVAVCGLMLGIFSMGVVLYTIVLLSVAL